MVVCGYGSQHLRKVANQFICSKKRDSVADLPIWLWRSFGTVAALLQEVSASGGVGMWCAECVKDGDVS